MEESKFIIEYPSENYGNGFIQALLIKSLRCFVSIFISVEGQI